jgi:glucosamine--fructose-6-phosphate aminotransferase (isomerizing)
MALKFKETCRLHAEAFSSAEVRHGPMALVQPGFPVLVLSQRDESESGLSEVAIELQSRGATVLSAGPAQSCGQTLPFVDTHPILQPLLLTQSFYRMVEQLARARGLDPDHPPHLRKVTETV